MPESDVDFLTRVQKVFADPTQEVEGVDLNRLLSMVVADQLSKAQTLAGVRPTAPKTGGTSGQANKS